MVSHTFFFFDRLSNEFFSLFVDYPLRRVLKEKKRDVCPDDDVTHFELVLHRLSDEFLFPFVLISRNESHRISQH